MEDFFSHPYFPRSSMVAFCECGNFGDTGPCAAHKRRMACNTMYSVRFSQTILSTSAKLVKQISSVS